jgi:hypothetical protein
MKAITKEKSILEKLRLDLDANKSRVRKARSMIGQQSVSIYNGKHLSRGTQIKSVRLTLTPPKEFFNKRIPKNLVIFLRISYSEILRVILTDFM